MSSVLNKRRNKIPDGAIYVGRPTIWGNKFVIGKPHFVTGKPMTRKDVIDEYEEYMRLLISLDLISLEGLRGKDLVCWCHYWDGKGKNPRYCHADILLDLVEESKCKERLID